VTRRRVLVLDDNEGVSGITRDVLEEHGFIVEFLHDTLRSHVDEMLARFAPEVILLDSAGSRSYGDSWGLAARLRRAPVHQRSSCSPRTPATPERPSN